MNLFPYDSTHYTHLSHWWKVRGAPALPEGHLPLNGLVVKDEAGSYILMGFVYQTDSDYAIVSWITGNPLTGARKIHRATLLLIDGLCEVAKDFGAKSVFFSTKHRGLQKTLERFGFYRGEDEVTNMIKELS